MQAAESPVTESPFDDLVRFDPPEEEWRDDVAPAREPEAEHWMTRWGRIMWSLSALLALLIIALRVLA